MESINYDLPRAGIRGSPLRNRSISPTDLPLSEEPLIRPVRIATGSNSSIAAFGETYTRSEILDIKCRERIETLMIDNDSIRRRLHLVEDEYKRTMQDKQLQYDKLAQIK